MVAWLQRTFHWVVDVLGAVAGRLYELPLSFLLVALLGGTAVIVVALRAFWPRARAVLRGERLGWGACVLAILALAVMFDSRQRRLEAELRAIERELGADAVRSSHAKGQGSTSTRSDLSQRVRRVLPDAQVSVARQAEGIDYAVVMAHQPRDLMVHLALIDLTTPKLRIELPEDLTTKGRLSDFCKKRRCVVGINGEAGEDPTPTSALGKWGGNLIVRGKRLMLQDTAERPFIVFDENNRARYAPAEIVDRNPSADTYNMYWGRWDLLVRGHPVQRLQHPAMVRPRPRCAMGIDGDGRNLFLATVDGYQHGYSEGATMPELASLLREIGVVDAMACDEGGSAAMYLGARGGLISRPPHDAGPMGDERMTFTYFGVSLAGP